MITLTTGLPYPREIIRFAKDAKGTVQCPKRQARLSFEQDVFRVSFFSTSLTLGVIFREAHRACIRTST